MDEHELLMREFSKIAKALAETFAPICEVVLHDLTKPDHAIYQIENNLSGRSVGGPATELGLARISNPEFPDVLVNYENKFADGRRVKSTSIGLRDSKGRFVAALCLNIDISYLTSIASYVGKFTETTPLTVGLEEHIGAAAQPLNPEAAVQAFAASRNKDPRSLSVDERRSILAQLAREGHFQRRGAAEQIANLMGISRSTVYYYLEGARSGAATAK